MSEYRFTDPPNTACFSCIHIVREKQNILYVSHAADDGAWQFLCGADDHLESDGSIVGLGTIVKIDPEINQIADMPMGVCAERKDNRDKWVFYKD
jgi:hypothetical protein